MGFAIGLKARQGHEPNRVHLRYGRIFRLGLLSTPHRCDAVTLSFIRPNLLLAGTLTPLTHDPHRRTDPPSAVGGLMGFLVEVDVMKLNSVLKSPWTAFHGSSLVVIIIYFRSSIFFNSRSSRESRSGASFFAGTRVFKNAAINPSTGSENLPAISDSSAIATTSQLPAQSGS